MRLKQLFLLVFAIVQHKAARTLDNNMLLAWPKKLPGVQAASSYFILKRLFNFYCNPHNQTKPKAAGSTTKSSLTPLFSLSRLSSSL